MSCFVSKALVNVGGELAKLVPGRVSTEVDARLAYDTHNIVRKVIVVYNPLGWKREEVIRIPVSTEVIVLDSAGREIESQLLPLPTEVGSSTISEVYTTEGSTDFTVEVGQGNLKLLYNANEGKLTHYINGRSLPQMSPQLGEIPRSTFQFDFELERKILAEAEKESQNWSRLGIENHSSKPAESTSSSLMMDFLAVGEELIPHRDFSNIGSCSQGKPAAANANDCQAPLQHLATVKNLSVVVGDSSGIGDANSGIRRCKRKLEFLSV